MSKIRFKRDGLDYICNINGNEYCVSKYFDVWSVWVNDERQDLYFDYIRDAKEWCVNQEK